MRTATALEQNRLPAYIPSLDGIRAFAVMIVMTAHSGFGNILPGGLGVTVFFFLSGFLITTLLENEFRKTESINIKHFFIRRLCRLFPPLLIVLLIGYSLAGFNIIDGGVSLSGFLYQVFYLANYQQIFSWSGDTPYGLGVLWSLAVEEHFYLVFPTLFLLIRRYAGVKPTVVFIMTLCIVVLCWRIHLVSNLEVIASRTYYATDTRIDSILWGCLLALTVNPCFTTKQPELNVKALFLIGLGVVVILLSLVYRNPEFRETYRYTIQGVALIPLFYYAVAMSESRLFKCLNWNVIKKLGVYSYSMYLIHFVVIGLIRKHELMDSKLLVLLCTLSVSVGFAALIDQYVDPYFRSLRKRFHS